MDKIKAEIRKYSVTVRIFEGRIFEQRSTVMNTYFEEESLMGVADRVAFRTKFIERVANKITRSNKQEEEKVKRTRKSTMVKLVVHRIFVI